MLAELLLLCVYVCVCETAACAYTRGVETAELLGGKIPLADLDYREVRLEIDADIAAFTVGLRDDVTSLDGRSRRAGYTLRGEEVCCATGTRRIA